MAVNTFLPTRPVRRWLLAAVLGGAAGCSWDQFTLFKPPTPPPPPVESFVLRPDGLAPEKPPAEGGAQASLAGAHELFRREEYDKAERLFHYLAENTKNPVPVVQEAKYYEAECLRLQGDFPKAADTYADLMKKFPNNPYRDLANQRMYDIALFWLEDTWAEMKEYEEKRQGKRWLVWPRFVSFEQKKPLLDREGRAVQRLDEVRYNDLKGPLADKALFLCGHVKLYNEDYREAEQFFTQIHELHPDSPYAAQATELAIFAKQMSTGGPDYDGRKAAEARKLVDSALRMPGMNDQKKEALVGQLKSITAQQAEKDFRTAEFYQRTGHPGSAYFYYEIVRRRYPGTEQARLATEKMMELRGQLEKTNGGEERRTPESAGPGPAPLPQPLPGPGAGAGPAPPRDLPPGLGR
jgi:TolA-binding protein